MSANDSQVGGTHYASKFQHWDFVHVVLRGRYLEGCITKYITRFDKKNGSEDLGKALHYIAKLKELFNAGIVQPIFYGARFDSQCAEFVEANAASNGQVLHAIRLIAHWKSNDDIDVATDVVNKLRNAALEREHAKASAALSQARKNTEAKLRNMANNETLPYAVRVAADISTRDGFRDKESPLILAVVEAVFRELGLSIDDTDVSLTEKTTHFEAVADIVVHRQGEVFTGIHRSFDFTPQPKTGEAFAHWIAQLYTMLNVGFDKWGQAWLTADEECMRRGLRDALAEGRYVDLANYAMFLDARSIAPTGRDGSVRVALANRFHLDQMENHKHEPTLDKRSRHTPGSAGSGPGSAYTDQG
jgi:hypothetical protein